MNHIYKSLYNKALGTWVAVPEIAKSHGKSAGGKSATFVLPTPRFACTALAGALLLASGQVMAANGGKYPTPQGDNYCYYDTDSQSVICGDNTTQVPNRDNGASPPRIPRSVAIGVGAQITDSFNTGNNPAYNDSVAIGAHSKVTGYESVAIGGQAEATERRATAIGFQAKAEALYGVALGYQTKATMRHSVAVGSNAVVEKVATSDKARSDAILQSDPANGLMDGATSASDSIAAMAIGRQAKAAGYAAMAQGLNANASAAFSTAIGANSVANKMETIAVGSRAEATGHRAIAIGSAFKQAEAAKASGDRSIALGSQTQALKEGSVAIGGWGNKNDPLGNRPTINNSPYAVVVGTAAQVNEFSDSAVVIGNQASAAGVSLNSAAKDSVAIGYSSAVTAASNIALGSNAKADDKSQATAIGYKANAKGYQSIAFGSDSFAGTDAGSSVALGREARVTTGNAVALGSLARADRIARADKAGTDAAATLANGKVYANAEASQAAKDAVSATVQRDENAGLAHPVALGAVSVGYDYTDTNGKRRHATRQITHVAAGTEDSDAVNVAQLKAVAEVAEAAKAGATHYYSVKRSDPQGGNYNNDGATAEGALAAGVDARAEAKNAVAIGNGAHVAPSGLQSVWNPVTKSYENQASPSINAVAVGYQAAAKGDSALALGAGSKVDFMNSVAVGARAKALGYNGSAFGVEATAKGYSSIAIGDKAEAGAQDANAVAQANYAVAIGTSSKATGETTVALGSNAEATAGRGTALGVKSQVTAGMGVALGGYSIANRGEGATGADPLGAKAAGAAENVWTSTASAVSVGGGLNPVNGNKVITRQIINVAAGSQDTDAVNVAQLKAAGFKLAVTESGGSATDSTAPNPPTPDQDKNISNGETFTLDAGAGINLVQNGGTVTISTNAQTLAESAQLPVVYTDGSGNKVYKHTDGKFYDQPNGAGTEIAPGDIVATMQAADGSVTTPTALTNVAAGANDTDAVNVSQLKGAAAALGGGAAINADGSFKAPQYTLTDGDPSLGNTKTYNTVGDALAGLNTAVNQPLTFGGDTGTAFSRRLGSTVNVKGGATGTLTEGNIGVEANNGTLNVKLAENINLGANGSVVMGDTKVDANGLAIIGGPSITKTHGINAGNKQITNVASGGDVDTNGANIGDVKRLAAAAAAAADTSASVSAGSAAVTVTKGGTTNGVTDYAVDLSDASKASLAKADTALQNVVGDGNITAQKNGDTVNLSLAPVVNIGPSTGGSPITINGNAGTIGGLSNTTWNGAPVSGRAATEDQLALVANQVAASQTHYYHVNASAQGPGSNYNNDGAQGASSMAAGVGASTKGNFAVAVGADTQANGNSSMAIGGPSGTTNTVANGESSMAIGFGAQTGTGATFSMAQGDLATVEDNATNATAIGARTVVKEDTNGATALGADSVADRAATPADAATSDTPQVGQTVYAAADATQADKDAISATVKGDLGAVSVGNDGATRQITNVAAGSADTDAVNVAQLKAVAKRPAVVNNITNIINNTTVSAGDNMQVVRQGDNYQVTIAPDISLNSVTTGPVTMDSNGLSINGNTYVDANGLNANGQTIRNVGAGRVAPDSMEAVNGAQLHALGQHFDHRVGNLENALGDVDKRARAGIASAMASAGLPQAYRPGASMVAASAGHYDGQTAIAIGASTISDNGRWILKGTLNVNSKDAGATVGVGYQW